MNGSPLAGLSGFRPMTFAPYIGGSSAEAGMSPSEPLPSTSGVNKRGGIETAPPETDRIVSAITSMQSAIGSSCSTSSRLIMRIRVF